MLQKSAFFWGQKKDIPLQDVRKQFTQQIQGPVLGRLHDLAFARSLVVDATQVQDPMNDGPMQLLLIRGGKLFGIRADGIKTDEQIACNLRPARIVERDDVGIIIVLQILPVDLQNLFVRTENITDVTGSAPAGWQEVLSLLHKTGSYLIFSFLTSNSISYIKHYSYTNVVMPSGAYTSLATSKSDSAVMPSIWSNTSDKGL